MVIWTPRARADLKAIHDYIAKDSRQNAKRVAREIRHKADALAEPPRPGRKVPEINDPDLCEISAYSWRIIYHLRNNSVFIVTLIHKRRQPGTEAFLPDYEPPRDEKPG
jgi:plasmid stabilization system protein ParE